MSDFQSGSQEEIRIKIVAEHDTDLGGGDFEVLPHAGNPTGPHKEWSAGPTDEVTSDLSINDNVARGFTVPFSAGNVFRHKCFDTPLKMVLGSQDEAAVTITNSTTIASAATGNKFTGSAGVFSGLGDQVPCHVWIKRGGSTPIAAAPYLALSVNGDGSELTMATATAGGLTLTTVAAGDRVDMHVDQTFRNGTNHIFAIIERAMLGVGQFHAGFGMICTKFGIQAEKGSDPKTDFSFEGIDYAVATATFGSGTETPAPSFPVFNTGSGLRYFRVGGSVNADLFLRSISLSIDSPVVAIDPAGVDGPYAHSKNRQTIGGEISLYTNTASRDLADDVNSREVLAVQFGLFCLDAEGKLNGYMFYVPAAQCEKATHEGGGTDGILMTKVPFGAKRDATTGRVVIISRFTDCYGGA